MCGVDDLWTLVVFLISFVILPLTTETGRAVGEGTSGELVAQNSRFPARLERGGWRVRFR